MRVLIIDGQGGGLGRQLVTAVKEYDQDCDGGELRGCRI